MPRLYGAALSTPSLSRLGLPGYLLQLEPVLLDNRIRQQLTAHLVHLSLRLRLSLSATRTLQILSRRAPLSTLSNPSECSPPRTVRPCGSFTVGFSVT